MDCRPTIQLRLSARRAASLLLAIAMASPLSALADPWQALTAEELPRSLQAHAQRTLAAARAGDVSMRAGIAFGLIAEGQAERARPLLLDTYRHLPETADDPLLAAQRQHIALMLAQMLAEGTGGPVDLETSVDILVPLARGGHVPAMWTMQSFLEQVPQLPASERLQGAWEVAATEGRMRSRAELFAEDDYQPEGVPDDGAFLACTGWLAEGPRLLQSVRDAEAAALRDPDNAQSHLGAALAAANALDPAPPVGLVDFAIDLMPARALPYLLAEDMGFKLHFAESVPLDRQASVWVQAHPRTLVIAWLLDSLGWRARCADDWVLIEPDPARSTSPDDRHPILLGPVLSVEPPAGGTGAASGEIVWLSGTRYQGEILAARPHGRGEMVFISGRRLDAEFRDGVPHGQGVDVRADGDEEYRGGFDNGHRHGRGHLGRFDDETGRYLPNEGRFERGHLVDGSMRLQSVGGPDAPVAYHGPFRMGQPHGEGECSAKRVRYRCGFVDGDLVSIGGVGLYPKPD